MRYILALIYLILCLFSFVVIGQETSKSSNINPQDSLADLRRKEYEDRLKFIKEMKLKWEKDPQGYADSVARVKEVRRFNKATARIEEYKNLPSLDNLTEIDLTGARLNEIPSWIYNAKNLEILVLDHNRIRILPESLKQLKYLRKIYLRYNDLGSHRIKIPKLNGIEKLDLTGNLLTHLPKVYRFDNLSELILEENSFDKIPTWRVRRLKNLKELDLSSNPIKVQKKWYGLLDQIEILKLNKCEIDNIHPSLYRMNGLKEIQIQVNVLRDIPAGISSLENLEKLSFYKNELSDLPADFFDLSKLRVVDFYYNEFERIPSEIGKLRQLEILYLSFNKLYDVPSEIERLSNLQELYIHHNRLSEIPESFSQLEKLRIFHFQNNYIPEFPSQILNLINLRDLDISNTDIRTIPAGISALKLKNFYWRNLDIDLNVSRNKHIGNTLLRLREQGTNVYPNVSSHDFSNN